MVTTFPELYEAIVLAVGDQATLKDPEIGLWVVGRPSKHKPNVEVDLFLELLAFGSRKVHCLQSLELIVNLGFQDRAISR